MTTHRLYLRQRGDPATADSVLLTTTPEANAVLLTDANGLRPLTLDAMFWTADVGDGETDFILGPIAGSGVTAGTRYVIPTGWTAHVHKLTIWTYAPVPGDITTVTAKLYADGNDASASFAALTLDITQDAAADAAPLAPPFVIAGSGSGPSTIDVRVTTSGTSGTVNVIVHVLGVMFPAI